MYVIVLPQASIRGNAYARAGAAPEARDAWIIVSYEFEARPQLHWSENVCQRLDPAVVQFFATKPEAVAWRRARAKHQQALGRIGPSTALIQHVKEGRLAA